MSEVMTPMSFEQLVEWVLQEKKKRGTVFGQHHASVSYTHLTAADEPCSDSIMRTGQMEHITGRCSGVLWRRRLDRQPVRIRR